MWAVDCALPVRKESLPSASQASAVCCKSLSALFTYVSLHINSRLPKKFYKFFSNFFVSPKKTCTFVTELLTKEGTGAIPPTVSTVGFLAHLL